MTTPTTPLPMPAGGPGVDVDAQQARCAPTCPLCGGPNACAISASGRLDTPCWCTEVLISAAVLARVPATARGQACICRRCAESAGPSADTAPT